MNKKIEELSEVELKALAFEHTLQLEHSQGAIVTIKNELLKRQQEPQTVNNEGKVYLRLPNPKVKYTFSITNSCGNGGGCSYREYLLPIGIQKGL